MFAEGSHDRRKSVLLLVMENLATATKAIRVCVSRADKCGRHTPGCELGREESINGVRKNG